VAVCGQHNAGGHRHLQRFPDTGRHPPADQIAAVAHRSRFRIALVPAECRRALAIAFAQLLAGVRQIMGLLAVGIAPQAQFQWIDFERNGKLIHRAFERKHAGRGSGRPHVGRRRQVKPGKLVDVFHIGGFVEQLRPRRIIARELFIL
jgi:hypothetical protein